jgi:hypothetical protein
MDGTWVLTWNANEKKRTFYLVKKYTDGTERKILVKDTRDIYKISHEQDIIDKYIERCWTTKLYRMYLRLYMIVKQLKNKILYV